MSTPKRKYPSGAQKRLANEIKKARISSLPKISQFCVSVQEPKNKSAEHTCMGVDERGNYLYIYTDKKLLKWIVHIVHTIINEHYSINKTFTFDYPRKLIF